MKRGLVGEKTKRGGTRLKGMLRKDCIGMIQNKLLGNVSTSEYRVSRYQAHDTTISCALTVSWLYGYRLYNILLDCLRAGSDAPLTMCYYSDEL